MPNGYAEALKTTLGNEGGYTVDSGGATMQGITQDTYNAFRKKMGLADQDVRKILPEEVNRIYSSQYYKEPGIDKLPDKELQKIMFDYSVNSGPRKAVMSLQKVVGAKVDGVMGPKTLKAVGSYIERNGVTPLLNDVLDDRLEFVENLAKASPSKYGKYVGGWKNRIQRLRPKE